MPAYIFGNGEEKIFIILLHGGPGGSGMQYRSGNMQKYLEQGYVMVYFDQRAQGMTQGKNDPSEINVPNMVEDIHLLIAAIKKKYGDDSKFYLMGHSWGGYLGTSFLSANKTNQYKLKGWIEIGGAHDIPSLYKNSVKLFKEVSQEQLSLGYNIKFWQEVYNYVQNIDTNQYDNEASLQMNKYAFEGEEKLAEDEIIFPYDSVSAKLTSKNAFLIDNYLTTWITGINANITIWDNVGQSNLTDSMKYVTIPSLFIWGKYDLVVPRYLGEKVHTVSGANYKKLVILEKSGHSPFENEANIFFTEVINFIENTK